MEIWPTIKVRTLATIIHFILCKIYCTVNGGKFHVKIFSYMNDCSMYYKEIKLTFTYVTGFVKSGLPHTSNLPTLTIHNFRLEKVNDMKFGQQRVAT